MTFMNYNIKSSWNTVQKLHPGYMDKLIYTALL